jgi:hypothetical protein
MGNSKQAIKNILRFYFEPEMLTPEEVEKELKEMGVDTEQIKNKRDEFLKKLEAKSRLRLGQKRKEKFEELLKEEEETNHSKLFEGTYQMAARKQSSEKIENKNDENLLKKAKDIKID